MYMCVCVCQVREVQRTVRDGRTGQQSMTITRGLGDKEKTVTRTRDATGRVHGEEVLRGIHDHEADRCAHTHTHTHTQSNKHTCTHSLPLYLPAVACTELSSEVWQGVQLIHLQRPYLCVCVCVCVCV